ncbi:hypothetical protein NQ317_012457 [Molorchus minor]|uniref:W2 domain-containing protein n=1 Tax=Molorchus minor TaxID=1323400 RepID=A0ABQ9JA71_9CUCU|nr:hypothetical protein NQ317_012457 [Molorchus minor]
MIDCLQAIQDATINEELKDKWYFYEKDYVTEDAILDWFGMLDQKSKFHKQVKPFTDWLREAEEASSSEDE